jgi:hypothetical protein
MVSSKKGQRLLDTCGECPFTPVCFAVFFLFMVVIVLIIAMISIHRYSRQMYYFMREPFGEITDINDPKFADPALSFPSKCFSCEAQFPIGERWRGQQTKCFACERAALNRYGGMITPQFTHPNKCFACEQ